MSDAASDNSTFAQRAAARGKQIKPAQVHDKAVATAPVDDVDEAAVPTRPPAPATKHRAPK